MGKVLPIDITFFFIIIYKNFQFVSVYLESDLCHLVDAINAARDLKDTKVIHLV